MASLDSQFQRQQNHTLGPTCRLRPITPRDFETDAEEPIPLLNAQFFYSSPIPIDDPLSAATTIGADSTGSKNTPLRPFSEGDNLALERAWLEFSSETHRKNHAAAAKQSHHHKGKGKDGEKVQGIVDRLTKKHWELHEKDGWPVEQITTNGGNGPVQCCAELTIDVAAELRREFCSLARKRIWGLDQERVIEGVMTGLAKLRGPDENTVEVPLTGTSPAVPPGMMRIPNQKSRPSSMAASADGTPMIIGSIPRLDDGISGKPFVRVDLDPRARQTSRSTTSSGLATPEDRGSGRARGDSRASALGNRASSAQVAAAPAPTEESTEVPVGISRLHMVSLPVLQMKPIYWSPVNDISTVLRATWFYRDTMVPVDPLVANQLEAGYRELRPWTETWGDELRSALDVGPLGEEKVSHRLWPEPSDKRPKTGKDELPPEPPISSDPFCAARCFCGEAAAEGKLEPVHDEADTAMPPPEARDYSNHHVIYKDGTSAFLLKASQQPSAYYNRRPISKIMKGATIGVPVIRGFDRAAWEKVHDKRAKTAASQSRTRAQVGSEITENATAPEPSGGCPGCRRERDRGQVTDLVLIAHGIGQKFAERVESFHFTHAVNAFRRTVNMELENPAVKSVLRPDQNGIMVLPVNWRHLLRFEDGGPTSEDDKAQYAPDGFSLKDIEPGTIPAVRSMISDVMFDIPFYMSHHKPKMIAALVGEANRVYRLWCQNNPGFSEKGRVHLIGHSLGSAMAVEILSKQPNRVPKLDLSRPLRDSQFFEFDTTNLFLLGSPAAFFLLLERGGLIPRRGRLKPGADAADTVAKDIVGEIGMFGCIAVDNIYNILAKEDPIAYLLNGTIDPVYAASLKTAYVPGVSTSFFKSMGDAVRGMAGFSTTAQPSHLSQPEQHKPSMMHRLPSQLELEVHDFTREDIAEKKAFLLNDNGQIDYYLRSGGGPLEIQYLNMLSAHTSYWYNLDLIRLLCVEVGRKPGKKNTLPAMRAVKIKGRFGGAVVGGR
ncbi:phospholipase DDHD1 [Podospora australis]|uniref:Phospholipase DDHD1 n=1 Tax=Podospora australis TaxID=1536484 RepID=A0AAN6WYK3_9PEZI|nr:phospholipase DDHD1 [Podospora australis]